jgi:hypothetical protein
VFPLLTCVPRAGRLRPAAGIAELLLTPVSGAGVGCAMQ